MGKKSKRLRGEKRKKKKNNEEKIYQMVLKGSPSFYESSCVFCFPDKKIYTRRRLRK